MLNFSETFKTLLLQKTSSWMFTARFCEINNTRYLIQIQQTNKYWLYRNANPVYFRNYKKKDNVEGLDERLQQKQSEQKKFMFVLRKS